MDRRKILLVYPAWSVFVQTDYEILSTDYSVVKYHFPQAKGALSVVSKLMKQLIFLIFNIWRFDSVFIWFADQHSILPIFFSKLAGKKSFLVIGGYDVCRIKSLNYGVFCSVPRGFAAAWSMKNSFINLPVSNHVARKVKAISKKSNYKMIYNCVKKVSLNSDEQYKSNSVLTVALIDSERTYLIKGIDIFIETARLLPDIQFIIVGFDHEKMKGLSVELPANLTLIPPTGHDKLPEYYRQAKVYCQLSRTESFGIALAEAIQHGAVPVISNEGGMPEVVGDKRCIVKKNPVEVAAKIQQIFSIYDDTGKFAAQRIQELFSVENRRSALQGLMINN